MTGLRVQTIVAMGLTAEIRSDSNYVTVYRDGDKPAGTLARRRVYATGPAWRAYMTDGTEAGAGFMSASSAIRSLARALAARESESAGSAATESGAEMQLAAAGEVAPVRRTGPIAREVMQWISDGNDSAVRYQDSFVYSRTLSQALAAGADHINAFNAAQGATRAELADYAVNSRLAWFRRGNRRHYLALRDAAALVGCEGVAE